MTNTLVSLITLITSFFSSFTSSPSGSTGTFDLLVNGQQNPPHVVVLDDLKPGDNREVTKDLYAKCAVPAQVYLHLKDVQSEQGMQTEPEQLEENGIPKSDLPQHLYYDLKLANQVIISLSDQILLADVVSCWIPIGTLKPNTHLSLYQSFHFPASVTNWAQGDRTTFTEQFYIQDARDPTNPSAPSGRIWNPALKKCLPGPTPTPKPTKKPTPTRRPRP